ncbi:MAG: precorrin-4 C(11)-methyltransferase [Desulfovibrionaceae bacterium]|nr:precorrin-4 C(11)-methyltransferase [Desulfovibrionaceae bacterium]
MPKVYFIGAGPGDPELLTLKAARLIASADVVVYAGSLVSPGIAALAKSGAELHDSAALTLEQTHGIIKAAVAKGQTAARVHTGDPSLYGAVREQAQLLAADNIAYEIVPGVTTAAAAAAALGVSFTSPETGQTLILTRAPGRTPVPEAESLRSLAAHRCALAIYLSVHKAGFVQNELLAGGLDPQTPVALVHRLGWPGEKRLLTTLGELASAAAAHDLTRQTVILVLPGESLPAVRSRLYDPNFSHGYR